MKPSSNSQSDSTQRPISGVFLTRTKERWFEFPYLACCFTHQSYLLTGHRFALCWWGIWEKLMDLTLHVRCEVILMDFYTCTLYTCEHNKQKQEILHILKDVCQIDTPEPSRCKLCLLFSFSIWWMLLACKCACQYTGKFLFHQSPTGHGDWTVMVLSLLTTAGSTVTTQLINCVITILLAFNSGDYTATPSLSSHCA